MSDAINKVLYEGDMRVDDVATAFLDALDRYKKDIDYAALESAIEADDYEAAKKALNTDEFDSFLFGLGVGIAASFVELLQESFITGAKTAILELEDWQKKIIVFDTLGQRGVEAMRKQAIAAVKDAVTGTVEGFRKVMETKAGVYDDIKRQAKEMAEIYGLLPNQAVAVSNYRKQLEARKVFDLTTPADRRIDALDRLLVQRHMTTGGLTQEQIDKLVNNYSRSLLEQRALTIARTEVMSAINTGRQELWEQAIDQGLIDINYVRKFWIVTPDDRLRATHAAIPLMNVNGVGIRSFFVTPFGNVYGPQDRRVELINCRCVVVIR